MNKSTPKDALTYAAAGVDIDAGNQLVERIKPAVARTKRPEMLGNVGGFGGLFAIPEGYKSPVLVAGTDGVGTKLKLAIDLNRHNTIGEDLVAMCVNDLIVQGAEPLFFLDYYATAALNVDTAAQVVESIAKACEMSGCALLGGETAEMPGMYQSGDYDLAGFCVGIVEKDALITGQNIKPGDTIIGMASSGIHSNGYSLVRKILEREQIDLAAEKDLADSLLAPTKIYVKSLLNLFKKTAVNGLAHITGGGLLENIPRVMPQHTKAVIDKNTLPKTDLYNWLQKAGNIDDTEMWRTFNCGVGMVVITPKDTANEAIEILNQHGETAWKLGEIAESGSQEPTVEIA